MIQFTVEPRFHRPLRLYNKSPQYNKQFLSPNNTKIYEKEPQYNETSL